MSLRQDALWIKQNWSYDQRKHWIFDMLALDMGFRWPSCGVDCVEEYGNLLRTIRHMKPAHRLLLRDIFSMGKYGVVAQFPDGRLWEVRRVGSRLFIRRPETSDWEENPLLRNLLDVLKWIETADLELWQPGDWRGRDEQASP
jgi:hypothetical protein